MQLTFKNEQNWHNVRIPSNDCFKDTIENEIKTYCRENGFDVNTSKVNIIDLTDTKLDVRNHIIVTFTIEKQ